MAPIDDVETYCENRTWKTRRRHSTQPLAAGGGKERQVTQGATVAIWYGVDHTITTPDGTTAETQLLPLPCLPHLPPRLGSIFIPSVTNYSTPRCAKA
jgi:hypothetical protein